MMEAINNLWNWISPPFAQSSTSEQTSLPEVLNTHAQEPLSPPIVEEEAEQTEETRVASEELERAAQTLTNHQRIELASLLTLLKTEALEHCKNRSKKSLEDLKATRNKQRDLKDIYNLLHIHADEHGKVTIPDHKLHHEKFCKLQQHGIDIECKENYTKEEKEKHLRHIDSKTIDADTEFKMHMHDVTENSKTNDLYLQTLKSLMDKQNDAVKSAARFGR